MEKYGFKVTICYDGHIDRSSTSKMIDKCHIPIIHAHELGKRLASDEAEENASIDDTKNSASIAKEDKNNIRSITDEYSVIFVDSQAGNSNISEIKGVEYISIDHHPIYSYGSEAGEKRIYSYKDIRPQYGACSTIIAEYYFENNVDMPREVATALLFGIKVDTSDMTRGAIKEDLDMFYRLSFMANKQILDELSTSTFKYEDIDMYAKAINNLVISNNIAFANAGDECPEVVIAAISDFMINIVDITFAIVYSVKKSGIKLSVRSLENYADAGAITSRALEEIGNGGGHGVMAGGFVPFTRIGEKPESIVETIEKRFIEELGLTRAEVNMAAI